jgi:hypothetical protein
VGLGVFMRKKGRGERRKGRRRECGLESNSEKQQSLGLLFLRIGRLYNWPAGCGKTRLPPVQRDAGIDNSGPDPLALKFTSSPQKMEKASSGCQSPGNGTCPRGDDHTRNAPEPHRPIDIDPTLFMIETTRVYGTQILQRNRNTRTSTPLGCSHAPASIERKGGSPRLRFAPKVRALPRGVCSCVCRAVCPRTAVLRLIMQAEGRKPPAAIRTEGARAAEGRLQLRLQGRLPADCRPAADDASGRAEAEWR